MKSGVSSFIHESALVLSEHELVLAVSSRTTTPSKSTSRLTLKHCPGSGNDRFLFVLRKKSISPSCVRQTSDEDEVRMKRETIRREISAMKTAATTQAITKALSVDPLRNQLVPLLAACAMTPTCALTGGEVCSTMASDGGGYSDACMTLPQQKLYSRLAHASSTRPSAPLTSTAEVHKTPLTATWTRFCAIEPLGTYPVNVNLEVFSSSTPPSNVSSSSRFTARAGCPPGPPGLIKMASVT